MIYFVQSGTDGPIKIGSAGRPLQRLATLRTGSPTPLRLLAVIEGGRREERTLHRHFAAERIRGEWFDPSGKLIALIARCREAQAKDRDPGLWLFMQFWDPLARLGE